MAEVTFDGMAEPVALLPAGQARKRTRRTDFDEKVLIQMNHKVALCRFLEGGWFVKTSLLGDNSKILSSWHIRYRARAD